MVDKQPWWRGPRGEWYVVVQFLLFALLVFGPKTVAGFGRWGSIWASVSLVAGLLLGLVGGLFILLGLVYLGRNLTAVPHPKENATFVNSGVYVMVRHPIYCGIILAAFGYALVWASLLTLLYALILFVFFDIKTRREEKYLRLKFPAYAAYQQRVAKLIPFAY
jgi:protein-S-isoprenylcysteine O-methyltransferase Ste14